jgi:hypothetical protein
MLNFAPLDKLRNGNGNALVGLFIGLFFTLYLFDIKYVGPILGIVVASVLIVLIIRSFKSYSATNMQNDAAYREFAEANNLNYVNENKTYNRGPGTLFSHGHDLNTRNILSGVFPDKLRFSVFNHTYDTGSGKSRTTHYATVMRVHLPRVLPHMVIDSHAEGGSSNSSVLPIEFDRSQRIELEGDFHLYFSCYAPDKYGVSLLSIIGPDNMLTLMEHAAACDIEIIDDNLYLYWPFASDDRQDYERVFETVQAVLAKIGDKLTHADIYATQEQALVHSSASRQGARLVAGPKVWGTLGAVSIFALYAMILSGQWEGSIIGVLAYFVMPIIALGVVVAAIVKNNRAQKLRTQLAQRFGKHQ